MVLVPFSEPAMSTTLKNPLFSFKFMFYIFLLKLLLSDSLSQEKSSKQSPQQSCPDILS